MDGKDFDAFKKSMEHERDIEFNENGWEELKLRMDEAEIRRRRPLAGWWMLAAAVLLPLIVGNIFLFSNLRETKEMNERLASKLEQLSNNKTDTIWREKVLYVHDTLTNEKIVYRNITATPEKYQQLQEVLTPKEIETLLSGKLPERLRTLPGETAPVHEEALAGTAGQKIEIPPDAPGIDLSYVPDLLQNTDFVQLKSNRKLRPNWDDYLTGVKLIEKQTPLLLKVKRAMKPDGLAISVSGGALFPISKKLDEPNGLSVGLAGEVIFSGHLRLRVEANYASISYSSKTMDTNLGIPLLPSPGDDFVFDQARVVQNALHFNVAMKYLMNVDKKLQPFLFAGYGTASVLPFKVYYDFKNTVTESEVQVEQETGSTNFISGFGIAGAGISFAMNHHLNLQLEGLYRTQLSKSSLSNPDLAGIRVALLYRF